MALAEMSDMKIKMLKFYDDNCFGENYNVLTQCNACWIKRSCNGLYKANIRAKNKLEQAKQP